MAIAHTKLFVSVTWRNGDSPYQTVSVTKSTEQTQNMIFNSGVALLVENWCEHRRSLLQDSGKNSFQLNRVNQLITSNYKRGKGETVPNRRRTIYLFILFYLFLAVNSGGLTWVRLQPPQEPRCPLLTVPAIFSCVKKKEKKRHGCQCEGSLTCAQMLTPTKLYR